MFGLELALFAVLAPASVEQADAAWSEGRYAEAAEAYARAYAETGDIAYLYARAQAQQEAGDCVGARRSRLPRRRSSSAARSFPRPRPSLGPRRSPRPSPKGSPSPTHVASRRRVRGSAIRPAPRSSRWAPQAS